MPAKKATKKAAKKGLKKAGKTVKKKTAAKKKAAPKKKVAAKKKVIKKTTALKAPKLETKPEIKTPEEIIDKPKPEVEKEMVECPHCKGVGKCTYGEIYDRDRHQSLFAEQRLTSCNMCLDAAAKPRNSKKLVACSVCGGTGEVEKQ